MDKDEQTAMLQEEIRILREELKKEQEMKQRYLQALLDMSLLVPDEL